MSDKLQSIELQLNGPSEALSVLGTNDQFLKLMEEKLDVSITTRGENILVSGPNSSVEHVKEVLTALLSLYEKGLEVTERDVVYAIDLTIQGKINQFQTLFEDEIIKNERGQSIRVKTLGQREYVNAMKADDLVFCIGPAGTGKTYLSVVQAVSSLKKGDVRKIILTRPAVEAGESLGFLPGDLKEKVDPYLRPLYDALHNIFGVEHTMRLIERETIEIAPLAYMRGRTLDDAFVILDEAQNTTPEQMKMFLTRLGFGSKMVVTGDTTQIDLPRGVTSGLVMADKLLNNIDDIGFVYLEAIDVVRHPLVKKIIAAYDEADN